MHSLSSTTARKGSLGLVIAMVLFASINSAFAQERSQDRDNPTVFDSKE